MPKPEYKGSGPSLIVHGAGDHRDPAWLSERTSNREALGWLDEIEAVLGVADAADPRQFDPAVVGIFTPFDCDFVRSMRRKFATVAGQEDELALILSGNQVVILFHIYAKIARRQRRDMEAASART